jgi:hypothetical protein
MQRLETRVVQPSSLGIGLAGLTASVDELPFLYPYSPGRTRSCDP